MRKTHWIGFVLIIVLGLAASVARAELTAEELDRLGKDLTPMGAERAGNAEGTIPAWQGGMTGPPPGITGDHHPDPFADDPVLFTITRENMAQYADRLTEGHKAMLQAYDTFQMNVYQSRRTASAPQRIYDATRKLAAVARLTPDGNGVEGGVGGVPFPIPKNGLEVTWNCALRYRPDFTRYYAQAAVSRSGEYTLGRYFENFHIPYYQEGMTEEKLGNLFLVGNQFILAPPRIAGRVILLFDTLNQNKEHRKAWVYNPGQRRVQRAPHIAFDNPKSGGDGLSTNDQFDMWSGSPERYAWKLIGKKEIYVPYNAYKLHSNTLKYTDILKPLHMNPDLLRYELHRVWIVEATLKEGTRHIYKKRVHYIDEDSWHMVAGEFYDNRDQLWRVSEGWGFNWWEIPAFSTNVECILDLQAGRYLAYGMNNEEAEWIMDPTFGPDEFSVGNLRRQGLR
jgi:hypothetical protein